MAILKNSYPKTSKTESGIVVGFCSLYFMDEGRIVVKMAFRVASQLRGQGTVFDFANFTLTGYYCPQFFSIYFLEHEKRLLISGKNERKIDKIKYYARRWKGLFGMVGKLLKEEMSQRGTYFQEIFIYILYRAKKDLHIFSE